MTKIVIIGGGPAGYEAALAAAAYGADITVIDSDGVGGACVLWDCVPSKTFIASTGIRTEVRRAVDLGINLSTDDALVTLPQPFTYFGTPFSSVYLAANGFAKFGSPLTASLPKCARTKLAGMMPASVATAKRQKCRQLRPAA